MRKKRVVRTDDVLDFGKNQGKRLSEASDRYLQWIVENVSRWSARAQSELDRRAAANPVEMSVDEAEAPRRKGDLFERALKRKRKSDKKPKDVPLDDSGIRTTQGNVVEEMEITDHTVNSASFRVLDRYIRVRDNWQDPPGFYTWLERLGAAVLRGGKQSGDYAWTFDDFDCYFFILSPSNSQLDRAVFIGVGPTDDPEPDWVQVVCEIMEAQ